MTESGREIQLSEWPDWWATPEDICLDCGCYGKQGWNDGEYRCPNCGNEWDVHEPPPDIP